MAQPVPSPVSYPVTPPAAAGAPAPGPIPAPDDLARRGIISSLYAAEKPDLVALIAPDRTLTFAGLEAEANRLARDLQAAGLGPGDGLALLAGNSATFVVTLLAAMRLGLRLTPVNWHLSPDEAAYIVQDCDAKALVGEARFAPALERAVAGAPLLRRVLAAGGPVTGADDLDALLRDGNAAPLADPCHGTFMLYTSGTTGRPKGVFKAKAEPVLPQGPGSFAAYDPSRDVQICAGPAYHAAPLLFDLRWPLATGVPIVMMDRFDGEKFLALVARHRVTHAHMVPTMFRRLLQLPADSRAAADVSSLRYVVHGAAPCPVDVKRAMIGWFGPVLHEYYAATEGGGGFHIRSDEWLQKPGSVGRMDKAFGPRILNADGNDCAPGEVGLVYLPADALNRFEYYKAPEKTAGTYTGSHFTLGDMGYHDEDGYLFLTGRSAELIISGGVNIYPQEVDDAVAQHPAVADVCTVGAPDDEWGEAVISVVEVKDGITADDALAAAILAFVRTRLSGFKCPRRIDFLPVLPRLASGKVQRGVVRQPYWAGRGRTI